MRWRGVPDQDPVQELTAAGEHPALHDRVHARHPHAGQNDLDAGVVQDGVEARRVLGVAVSDQVSDRGSGVLEVHDQVPGGLGNPVGGGVGGGAHDADPAVSPLRILLHQPQHQHPDRAHRAWPARSLGTAGPGVTAAYQVAVPAQHGVRADQKLQAVQYGPGQRHEYSGQKRPIGVGERRPRRTQLPLQNRKLMPQDENLHVLVTITHRQQPQRSEDVRDREVGQTHQHERRHAVAVSQTPCALLLRR